MPLRVYLGLLITVILAAGLSVWAASALSLPMGILVGLLPLAALLLRWVAWR